MSPPILKLKLSVDYFRIKTVARLQIPGMIASHMTSKYFNFVSKFIIKEKELKEILMIAEIFF